MNLAEAKKCLPPMWVIYDHPKDFPDSFVIRVWYGTVAEPEAVLTSTLNEARDFALRQGASVAFQPDASDDPVIVETWI